VKSTLLLILFLSVFNLLGIGQENDSVLDLGVDSAYQFQLDLKAKQGTRSDCEFAIDNANNDFDNNIYTLHSEPFFWTCSYCFVLKQDYNINWRFQSDLFYDRYYNCYDSIMKKRLIEKYDSDIFGIARTKSDSLDNLDNWMRDAEFIGGQQKLMSFILSRLTIDSVDTSELKTKIYIEIEIDSTGQVLNSRIMRGINDRIDKKTAASENFELLLVCRLQELNKHRQNFVLMIK
jgi:hypothetical protein